MSCGHSTAMGTGTGTEAGATGRGTRTHHEVPTQHQGHDLRLGGRIAVVVTGQVSAAPPARPAALLPVVARAEHTVQAEQQQDQDDAGGQAERRHPAERRVRRAQAGPGQPSRSGLTCTG